MLTTAALFQLAMQCAPAVHPDTIHDITRTESGLNPYAIAEIVPVKGGRSRVISHLPSSKDEALKIVEAIKQKKHRYSVGLMQITSTNFPQFGVSAESMFNPCDNMTVAAKIITDCYQRGGTLQRALSCYYSGNFETGQRPESAFGNTSYVQRIGYVVPSTRAEQQTASPSSGEAVGRLLAQSLYGLAVCQTLVEVALDVADQFNHRRFDGFDFRKFRFWGA
jgi:type IV secretion system protein VirB1